MNVPAHSRYKTFDEINSKLSPETKARLRAEALAEIERIGYGALRKARRQTQIEVAAKLGISQPSIAELEKRTDVMLSTLARYIEALGGRLEVTAVFPEATFNLAPPASAFHEGFAETAASVKKGTIKPFQGAARKVSTKSRRRVA